MATRMVCGAVRLSTAPQLIKDENLQMIGSIIQNQEAVANIFVRSGGDGSARSYLRLSPGGDMMQDILPPQDEVWAYSDVAGAMLTYWEKYSA